MANSTQIITDLGTVITNGAGTSTAAAAVSASGNIQDYVGNVRLLQLKAQEMSVLMKAVVAVTDPATDGTNLGLLQGVQNILK